MKLSENWFPSVLRLTVIYLLASLLCPLPSESPPNTAPGMDWNQRQRLESEEQLQENLKDGATKKYIDDRDYSVLLTGVITDFATTKPLAAKVEVFNRLNGAILKRVSADSAGRYKVRALRNMPLMQAFSAPGYYELVRAPDENDLKMFSEIRSNHSLLERPQSDEGKHIILFSASDSKIFRKYLPPLDKLAEIMELSDKYVLEIAGFGGRSAQTKDALIMGDFRSHEVQNYLILHRVAVQKTVILPSTQGGGNTPPAFDYRVEIFLRERPMKLE